MNYLDKFCSKTKQQPDIWFFYGFLFTFLFSVRKIVDYFPIQRTGERTFNEYSAIFIYISDIFLFLTILSWIILILSNNNNLLSIVKLWITSYFHKLYNKFSLESKFLFYNQPEFRRLSKNKSNLSSPVLDARLSLDKIKMFHVEHLKNISFMLVPLFIIIWSFVSIIWSQNQNIAFFRSIKLLEYYLLYIYIVFRFIPYKIKTTGLWNSFILIILFFGLSEAIIGIVQFAIQHSIGLFWLKESLISPNIDGVAKIVISGHKYIRAYGLFPHPNIFGGFLLLTIVVSLMYKRMFHACPVEQECSTWNILYSVEHYLHGGTYLNALIAIQALALLLTFSKSAIFGLAIALLYIYFPHRSKKHSMFHTCPINSDCSTWNNQNLYGVEHNTPSPFQGEDARRADDGRDVPHLPRDSKLFHVEQFRILRGGTSDKLFYSSNFRVIILILLILIFTAYLSWPNITSMVYNSIDQRGLYLNVSPARLAMQSVAGGHGTIQDLKTLILGVGMGQFVLNMPTFPGNFENWQFQPVHNVFLLIWSELGIVGLGLFVYWLYKMLHACPVDSDCSTWNNRNLYGVEHNTSSPFQGEGLPGMHSLQTGARRADEGWDVPHLPADEAGETNNREVSDSGKSILQNKYNNLSNILTFHYFKAILLGFIFIMLFDHYLWDIQQGNFLLWMTMGIIAGTKLSRYP